MSDKGLGKHTPGPWHVDPKTTDIRDSGGDLVVSTVWEHEEPSDIVDANARLIAAAPELLEALRACHDVLLMKGITGRAWELARAAIAKAEGR